MPGVRVQSLQAAIDRLTGKAVVGSSLDTRAWSGNGDPADAIVPVGLRDAAFYMATVRNRKTLDQLKDLLGKALDFESTGGAPFMDRGAFTLAARKVMQDAGLDDGSVRLTNPASPKRLRLVYDFQMEQAYSHGRYMRGQEADLLESYPAQEFLRIESREHERPDWQERWVRAGGKMYEGRMIALKTDPVWTRLSRFGVPYPPFDFGSGMGIENVERDEAERLGLLQPGDVLQPTKAEFAQELEESVQGLSPESIADLKSEFGDQLTVADGKLRWSRV